MNALVNYLVEGLLYEDKGEVIALIPGGYKPVTISHFHIVDEVSKRSEVNKVIVLIGPKERDGITAADSLAIWKIYSKYLNSKVEFKISKISPVNDVYDYLKDQPNNFYLLVFGREDSERFNAAESKYNNCKIINFKDMGDDISGTAARKQIKDNSYEGLQKFLPTELTDQERQQVWNIVTHKQSLNEEIKTTKNDSLLTVDIIEDGKTVGNIAFESSDGINYTIIDAEVKEKFRNKGYYKKALLDIFKKYPNIKIISVFRSKDADNAWNSLLKSLPSEFKVEKHFYRAENTEEIKLSLREDKYHDKLVKMALRKDPDRLTELGKEYLDEAKQVGTLYHFTSLYALKKILNNWCLKGMEVYGDEGEYISFSRNKDLIFETPKDEVRIVLDGNKMSEKYKFEPYLDNNNGIKRTGGEAEERINTQKYKDKIYIQPYIKSIDFNSDLYSSKLIDEEIKPVVEILQKNNVQVNFVKFKTGIPSHLVESKESLIEELTNHLVSEYTNQQTLNPTVFELKPERSMGDPQDQEYTIKPKVREVLLKIADYFWNQTPNPKPYEDVILLGSSANYNWNQYSDIDVHILVDFSKYDDPEMAKGFYNELKSSWNKNHKLKLGNNFIELYVQDINEPNAAEGIYSLVSDSWLKQPVYSAVEVDDNEIARKAETFKKAIDKQLVEADLEQIRLLQERIKNFRKAGLEENGEYSVENLAFKELRNSGYIEKLINLRNSVVDKQLVTESGKELNVQDIVYKQDPTILEKGIKKEKEFLRAWLPQVVKGVWEKTMREREPFWKFLDSFKGSIKRVPLSSIKPSQTGEDYENNSSKYEAEIYKKILSGEKTSKDIRINDFYPILVNGNTNKIIDGNHRHYALSAINSPYAVCLFVNIPIENLDEEKIKKVRLNEVIEKPYLKYLKELLDYCCKDLQIEKPELAIINGNKYTQQNNSFGGYSPTENKIWLVIKNRNLSDSMRTLAHELKHHSQNLKGELVNGAGKDGDNFENEANSYAGKIMREFNRKHPEILTLVNV